MGSGSKQKTKSTEQSTQVTTPTPPSWIEGPLQDFTGRINDLAGRDPNEFVTPASQLQTQAFEAGGGLLEDPMWRQALGAGAGLAIQGASQGPSLAAGPGAQTVATATMPTMGAPAQAAYTPMATPGAITAGTASGGAASGASAQGYSAAASTAAPVVLGAASGYSAQQVDPRMAEIERTQLGPAAQAGYRSLLDLDLSRYMTPELQGMIDATKADAEAKQGQDLARAQSEAMATGAIRGSGRAVREGILTGENTRALTTALANMRGEAWRDARDAATSDLGRESEVNIANMGARNDVNLEQGRLDASRNEKGADILSRLGIANMDAVNQASAFTAGAKNDRNLKQGDLDVEVGTTNARLGTDASIASARNLTDASTTTSRNLTDASIASARNATDASTATLSAQTQTAMANLDATTRTNIANMDNQTRVALENAQSANDQANLLARLGVDVSTANASQLNEMTRAVLGETGQTARFNAGQMDAFADRQLDAAGVLGQLGATYGTQQRGDIETVAGLGDTQRDIQVSENTAEIDMMRVLSQLYGGLPIGALTGSTTDRTGSGTSTTTSSPGLLDIVGTAAMGAGALGWAPFASDERLKADVETVGYDAKGRRWVDFRYRDDPVGTRHRGVIAQEVARSDPHAVSLHPSGYLQVRYDLLEAA